MPSLHENGWRQGSVFDAPLKVYAHRYADGEVVTWESEYARWVVVSQDCDLASADSEDNESSIEVMPALEGDGGGIWGIRSRVLRLSQDIHTDASLPKLRLSPAALSVFIGSMQAITVERTIALKTWLGRRYDRPAVPPVLVDLARAIARAVKNSRTPELSEVTHDVLFAATEERPARFQLLAVITDESHAAKVREWLASAALDVDPSLGSLSASVEAITKSDLTLTDIENTFSADLSDITWGKGTRRGAI